MYRGRCNFWVGVVGVLGLLFVAPWPSCPGRGVEKWEISWERTPGVALAFGEGSLWSGCVGVEGWNLRLFVSQYNACHVHACHLYVFQYHALHLHACHPYNCHLYKPLGYT